MDLKFHSKAASAVILIHLLFFIHCLAQPINLNEVKKIEFETIASLQFKSQKHFEVVRTDSGWMCYQTWVTAYNSKVNRYINYPERIPVKAISPDVLIRLLSLIAHPDTTASIHLFKLKPSELLTEMDSLHEEIKPEQKAEFLNALNDGNLLMLALQKVLDPFMFVPEDIYKLTITTTGRIIVLTTSTYWNSAYSLPWSGNGVKSYNPDITAIFDFITDEECLLSAARNTFLFFLEMEVFHKRFETRFNWENFKADYPKSYAILKDTITPERFFSHHGIFNVSFRSSRLPPYAVTRFYFEQADTNAIHYYKTFEDTLVKIFKHRNFLFQYVAARPGLKVQFEAVNANLSKGKFLDDILKHLHSFNLADFRKSYLITVYGSPDMLSKWLLVPGNRMVLLAFYGTNIAVSKTRFMNFILDRYGSDYQRVSKNVFILFDKAGNITHDYGASDTDDWH